MRRSNLIKVVATTLAAAVIATVGWLAVANAAGGPNLSLGKAASASSTNGGFGTGNLNDGNQGSYWESTNNAFPQWAQLDLGAATSIDQVVLKLPTGWGARTQTLTVQGSLDGSSFSTLVASGGRVFDPASANTVTLNFTAASTRYVRVTVTANTGWAAAQLSELEIYGVASSGGNLAAGRPTSDGGHSGTLVSGNAVDGNQASYWEGPNSAFPNFIQVDLGVAVSINRVVLKVPTGWGTRTQTLSVQGSTNNTTFTDIVASAGYTFNPASANTVTINLPATSTRYVRLRFTANTAWPAGQLSEFEVYAGGTPPPPDTTPPTVPGTLSFTQSSSTINLAWGASTDTGGSGLAGYNVYRGGALIATLGTVLSYADTTQPTTVTVSYFVRARDGAGNLSGNSNTVTRTGTSPDTTPPTVPGTLSFTQSGSTINLAWGASTDTGGSGLAGYNVYRDGNLIATLGTVLTYADTTQPTTATVSYFVRARDGAGNLSGNSNTVTRTGSNPDITPPTIPGTLSFTQSGTTINLSWGASNDGSGTGLAGYNVYRNSALIATLGTVLTYADTTQPASATVSYFVRSRDNAGNLSANSNTVTRTGTGNPPTNVALNKPVTATGSVFTFVPANATDGNVTTYWEGSSVYPQNLTVALGANHIINSVVVKLNPAASWGTRTQNFQVLGRDQASATYTSLVAAATYTFTQGSNVVTIPVSATTADIQLRFNSNSGAPGAQVAELEVFGVAAPNPDLTVSGVGWSPSSVNETTSVTLSATVNNIGTATSAATTLNFTLNGTVKATANVGPVGAGGSTPVTLAIGTLAMASYVVGARVDPTNTLIEQNDTNNAADAPSPLVVAQAPGPDLQVLSITPNPASPAAGAAVSFTVAVNNRGTQATGATTVTRVTVGSATLNTNTASIPAFTTVNVAITGTWTAVAGGATITATADATNVVTETNETNNSLSQAIVVGRGAAVPYVEYEAEAANYQGTLLVADALRTFGHTNFGTESSGRQSVRLNSTGQFVEFTSTNQANSIVVRNSIPDAAGGGGQESTISLYINGTFSQKITLSSKHSWLYGTGDGVDSLSNSPQADARRLFDESQALLSQSYPSGTRFRLQRDATDSASFYIIDFIDLEQVAPALSQPAGCTSITTYGAVPNDGIDDSAAIQRAVTDDENGVISCVWIPAGQWRQEQKILSPDPTRGLYNQKGIRNAVIRGAGMWYTKLYTLIQPQAVVGNINHKDEGNVGFDIDDNVQLSDLAIFGATTNRSEHGHGINGRLGKNTRISNVWIEHTNVGAWVGRDYSDTPTYWNPGDGIDFSGMRIRDTYADGINFANSTRNSRVFNSSFRTTGDDSLAVWASKFVKDQAVDVGHDNHFTNNTIQLPWRANGIAIYGGFGNAAENNLIYDTMNYPGIMLATDHSPIPFSGTTTLANNGLFRCGGVFWGEVQKFGAITLFAPESPIVGVTIRDSDIIDSTYDGIQFKSAGNEYPNVAITNVRIDKSNNGAGILAQGSARGTATLVNVLITNSATGNVVKDPGSTFTFVTP